MVTMSGRKADDECMVGWCAERFDHAGPHRLPLHDTFALNVQTGKPEIVQLWLQGESARVRALVIVTGARETGLTWRQADELASLIVSARRRYAS
jgi:hypothetical protein